MKPTQRVSLATMAVMWCLQTTVTSAQTAPSTTLNNTLRLDAFLTQVGTHNLDLAAQRFNLSAAEAQIAMARVFPDPVVTGGVMAVDVSGVGAQNAYGVGVTVPLEFPTKRSARIEAASASRDVVRAEVDDYFRNVRADAANAFVNALAARMEAEFRKQNLANLNRLVQINEQRLHAGDVGEVAVIQARVEASRFRSEIATTDGEVLATAMELERWTGQRTSNNVPSVVAGDLRIAVRHFDADELIARAMDNRPDVHAQRQRIRAASSQYNLAVANRAVDVAVGLGWQYLTPGANGSAFQAPSYHTLALTLSVPIPLSRVYRGDLDLAIAEREQAQTQLDATSLQVEVQIRQALARYNAAVQRLAEFNQGLLSDSQHVLETTLYNYQRGGGTLLEVLNAQRTVTELYLAYTDALAGHVHALIEVERAVGMWDMAL